LRMGNVRGLHDKAMEFAQQAMVAFHKGELEKAGSLARQGYEEYEAQAAYLVPKREESEPTRGILYRGAATLAWQCEEFMVELRQFAGPLRGSRGTGRQRPRDLPGLRSDQGGTVLLPVICRAYMALYTDADHQHAAENAIRPAAALGRPGVGESRQGAG
jgi:hypothetical protein